MRETGQVSFTLDKSARDWARRQGLVAIYLHGSQVKREDPSRDIDIALLLGKDSDWESQEMLREQAESVLAKSLRCAPSRLDIQFLDSAPPDFQYRVIRCRRLLFEGEQAARVAFERRLLSEFLDFRYYQDQHYQAMNKRLQEGTFGRRPQIRRADSV